MHLRGTRSPRAGELDYPAVPGDAVTVFASFRPLAGKADQLHALLSWMVERTRAEPGCERYDLYRRAETGETLHLLERYRDDGALAAHRATDHYVEYRRRVADVLQGGVDVVVLEPVDVAN